MTTNHDLWHIQSAEQPAILMFKTRRWSFGVQHITLRERKATRVMGQIIFLTMILPSFLSTIELHEARPANDTR
jgi:hypothetical protein